MGQGRQAPLNCQVQHPQHRRWLLLLINTTGSLEETEKPLRNTRVHTAVQLFPYQKHSHFSAGPLNPPWDQPSEMNALCGRCQHCKAVPQKRSSVMLMAARSLCANTVGYRHMKRLRAQSRRHFVKPRVDRQRLSERSIIPNAALPLRATASWGSLAQVKSFTSAALTVRGMTASLRMHRASKEEQHGGLPWRLQ